MFVVLVVIAGAAATIAALGRLGTELGPIPIVLALGAAAAVPHVRPLKVPRGDHLEDVLLEEAFLPVLFLLLPPGGVLVAASIASTTGHLVRRRPVRKCAFNYGAESLGLSVALVVQDVVAPRGTGDVTGGELLGAALAVAAFAIVVFHLVWAVMALATGDRLVDVIRAELAFAAEIAGIGIAAGLVTSAAARSVWWAALAVIPPLLGIDRVLGQLLESQRDRRRLNGLLRTIVGATRALASGTVEQSLAGAAAEHLRAPVVVVRDRGPGAGEVGARIGGAEERWLVAGGRHRLDPFDDSDRALLEGIAGMGSIALENATLLDRLRHQALHDPLTGVPNRALFDDRLSRALQRADTTGRSVSVLYVDVDRFKRVNDSLGHGLGDELLKAVAVRIADQLRPVDTVARIGGDEFAVLVDDVDSADFVEAVAKRLLDALRQPFELDGRQLFATVSVGIATSPHDGTDARHLVSAADMAMYRAKRSGRDAAAVHSRGVDRDEGELLALETALHDAVRLGQLWVAYQPLADTASGRICGVEALVRWEHPELGTMPPDRFLGLAEDAGLLAGIDLWVLRTAAAQVASWRADGLDLDVAVNLSSRSLYAADLEDVVADVLAATGLPAGALELEVTEQVAADEPAEIVARLGRLRKLGVRVAIDDFGTGWSSLSRLDTFPVDRLKLDRSLVGRITDRHAAAPIVTGTIAVAHELGLVVTAEGVETEAQLAFLRDHGCDTAQGWLIGRPVPADRFHVAAVAGSPAP